MKKVLFLILFMNICSATHAEFNILNVPDVISIGRCNMGYCSWSKSLSTKIISRSNENVLLEATLLGGTSVFEPQEDGSGVQGIEWNKKPHKVIVNCSYKRPSIGSGSQLTMLDLSSYDAMPARNDGDISLYLKYCHSFIDDHDHALKDFGYIK